MTLTIRTMLRAALAALAVATGLSPVKAQALGPGEKFEDWTAGCEQQKGGETTAALCFISQRLMVTRDGQQKQIMQIAVGLHGENRQPAALMIVPLGVFLPAGIVLDVPGVEPLQVAVQTCTPEGCRGITALDGQMLDAMRKGSQAQVRFRLTDAERRQIDVPFSLKGFTKGFTAVQQQ